MEAVVIGVFVLLGLAMATWHYGRAGSLLASWAKGNGFELLSQENCLFFRGPYFWTTTRGQEVYRVSVRDREGRTRSGYVRCGGTFLGMLGDQVDVRWDE